MLHTFKIPVFSEGERSIQQRCLKCGTPSIVYKPRSRFYYNGVGRITKSAPQCLEPRILHNFETTPVPMGEKMVIQTCKDCGRKRVLYASGCRAYFDEVTGAKIPYVPPCTKVNDAKVVSIRDFKKATQVDKMSITTMGKFVESVFIIQYIYQKGLDEHSSVMISSFLESLVEKQIIQTNVG